jgi:hypothetical protein
VPLWIISSQATNHRLARRPYWKTAVSDVDENKGRLSATEGRTYDVYENKKITSCMPVEPKMLLKNKPVSGLKPVSSEIQNQKAAL